MRKKGAAILALAAGMCMAVRASSQPSLMGDVGAAGAAGHTQVGNHGLEAQKARLDQDLQKRVADIEKRFKEEQAFRAKMKDERLAFEKKLVQERKSFLDSTQTMNPEERQAAWSDFFKRVRQKRDDYNQRHRAESKKFWEARAQQRRSYDKSGQNGSAH